jgi:hypothetical protein
MSNSFELFSKLTRLRTPLVAALIVALAGCDGADSFSAENATTPEVAVGDDMSVDEGLGLDDGVTFEVEDDSPLAEEPAGVEVIQVSADGGSDASLSFAGGIAFGAYHLPNSAFGSLYNGALRNIYPAYLLSNLRAIKERGGKVVLSFAGSDRNYKDADGDFSLTKWKALVSRFRNLNFSSYINDGTIIAHYLMDEPNNTARWGGRTVSGGTVEEMARYSKAIWPSLATVVRAYPDYMDNWSGTYRYLDAAWIQYVYRKGEVGSFASAQIAAAQRKGLGVIVGLNVLRGGVNNSRMTPSQVRSWGSTLLSSSYPCAFISWQYDSYLMTSSMKDAMNVLRDKAESRSTKSCRT